MKAAEILEPELREIASEADSACALRAADKLERWIPQLRQFAKVLKRTERKQSNIVRVNFSSGGAR